MDSVHCCIVSCCSEVPQTPIRGYNRPPSMLNARNIGLCVLIVVAVAVLIFPSIFNLTTSELVVNNDNNHHSIAVQKTERIVQLLTVIKGLRVSLLYHSEVIHVHSVLQQ